MIQGDENAKLEDQEETGHFDGDHGGIGTRGRTSKTD